MQHAEGAVFYSSAAPSRVTGSRGGHARAWQMELESWLGKTSSTDPISETSPGTGEQGKDAPLAIAHKELCCLQHYDEGWKLSLYFG